MSVPILSLALLAPLIGVGCDDDEGGGGGESGAEAVGGGEGASEGEGEGEGEGGPGDASGCIPNNNGVEICNGLDDDCNGETDDVSAQLRQLKNDVLNCGACGNRCQASNADPYCRDGSCGFTCARGWSDIDEDPTNGCEVHCVPTHTGVEECDGVDNDCDEAIDEDFDFYEDPAHCGGCHQACDLPGVLEHECKVGDCLKVRCGPGYQDLDGDPANGCEYPCLAVGDEVETCDGADNDCDGLVDAEDEDLAAPNFACLNLGVCQGVEPECDEGRWRCDYPDERFTDGGEVHCDNLDNDCDGAIDEDFSLKGEDCERGWGVCADRDVWQCTPDRRSLHCLAVERPERATVEVCDGVDNDCDGRVDNDVVDLEWIQVGNSRMYAYEASRPDATALSAGNLRGRGCSVPGVMPWAEVSHDEAREACRAGGWRLCTLAEWTQACGGPARTRFPYANDYDEDACNGRVPGEDAAAAAALATGHLEATCSSRFGAVDMSGNLKEWTATLAGGEEDNAYFLAGGAYDNVLEESLSCFDSAIPREASFRFPNLGFRCCITPEAD